MQNWEYKAVVIEVDEKLEGDKLEAELDRLGSQGWELVAVRSSSEYYEDCYYFKRPAGE